MNKSSIYHQSYDNFCYALDEETILITLQTAKDVTSVTLVYGDPFSRKKTADGYQWLTQDLNMTECVELANNYLWRARVTLPFRRCKYYFKVYSQDECIYYLEDGTKEASDLITKPGDAPMMGPDFAAFTFPWLNACDVCKTPKWARSAIFYQIFPSRFCKGELHTNNNNSSENIKDIEDDPFIKKMKSFDIIHDEWPDISTPVKANDVYGGNLQGIIDKLDYLRDLGVTGIYTTPINFAPSQHKYDTTDYNLVDPTFGTNDTMKLLVSEAHSRGIRVMVDGVFNHSGWLFKPWQDVIHNGKNSRYAKWFCVNDYDITVADDFTKMDNVARGKYHSFAFTDFMPKINTGCDEVADYIIKICLKWVSDWDIDGIRLDVANELSHKFLRKLRNALDNAKADFFIVGEAWHGVQNFLRGDEYTSVMNYPLQNAILNLCESRDVKQFQFAINRVYSMYYEQVNSVLFNQLDSHDTVRLVTKLGNKDLARAALAILFTLPGTTCIYYGTEIMLAGDRDPDCRRCMPWKSIANHDYDSDIDFTKSLIALRKKYDACYSVNFTIYSDPDNKTLCIKKTSSSGENIYIAVNLSNANVAIKNACNATSSKNQNSRLLQNYDSCNILLSNGFCNDSNSLLPCGFIIYRGE